MFKLIEGLRKLPDSRMRVFALLDMQVLLPTHVQGAFKSVVARLEKHGDLIRVCRGIYMLAESDLRGGDLLGCTAARLRAGQFNYLSLEYVLSEAGVISQIPLSRLTLMSSGRSGLISCGRYGELEFIHTSKTPPQVAHELQYDSTLHLWRASVPLALQDMKVTRRDTGLVDWEAANEFIR